MFTFVIGVVIGYVVKGYIQDEVTSIATKVGKAIDAKLSKK